MKTKWNLPILVAAIAFVSVLLAATAASAQCGSTCQLKPTSGNPNCHKCVAGGIGSCCTQTGTCTCVTLHCVPCGVSVGAETARSSRPAAAGAVDFGTFLEQAAPVAPAPAGGGLDWLG
jgi:hypothetical protein